MTDERRKALEALRRLTEWAMLHDPSNHGHCDEMTAEEKIVRQALAEPAVPAYDSEGNDLSDPTAWEQPAVPEVTDDMAFAFHHAITDGALSGSDLEEIKCGLRAAIAGFTEPAVPYNDPDTLPTSLKDDGTLMRAAQRDYEATGSTAAITALIHLRQWIDKRAEPAVPDDNDD